MSDTSSPTDKMARLFISQKLKLAKVTLQNHHRALDLLTAEKDKTCVFLQEECCFYVNESGLVEQNMQTLTKLSDDLRSCYALQSSSSWMKGRLTTWVLPFVGSLVFICLLFFLASFQLKFIQLHIRDVTRVIG